MMEQEVMMTKSGSKNHLRIKPAVKNFMLRKLQLACIARLFLRGVHITLFLEQVGLIVGLQMKSIKERGRKEKVFGSQR